MTPRGRRGTAVALVSLLLALLAPQSASAKSLDPWWASALQIDEAHQVSTGKGVRIAVIDGALNADIPELQGADVRLRVARGPSLGSQLVPAKSYPRALYAGHGTAMTTLIVGQGKGNAPGGAGITGIAPDAEVFFYQTDPDPTKDEFHSAEILFEQAIKDKVDIISYSSTGDVGMGYVIEQAQKAGIVVVVGAGIADGAVGEPADKPGVVAVGAVDKTAQPWKRQPQGIGKITVVAPGVDVPVGGMRGSATDARWVSGMERTGTSDATPLVAGALALVKSKYPDATANQLIQQLIHSVSGRDFAWGREGGFGVISLREMLARDPAGWPDVNPLMQGPEHALATFPPSVYGDASAATTPAAGGPADSGETPAAAASRADDDSSTPWLVGGLLALALLVVVITVLVRRTRHTALTTSTGGTTDGTQ